jgi:hypothetical protein
VEVEIPDGETAALSTNLPSGSDAEPNAEP